MATGKRRTRFLILLAVLLAVISVVEWNSGPPIEGVDVWLVDHSRNNEEVYGGFVNIQHIQADRLREECQHRAHGVARMQNLESWTHYCCTVTAQSRCKDRMD